ncbi:MAG: hypothetical protein JNJ77_07555 [Planctomycetia bacterium]|nr:hypothetical protein [Planctomycetia bacterium]
MSKKQFREKVKELLSSSHDVSLADKVDIIELCITEALIDSGFEETNKHKPWTDSELKVVLQHAPTKENCITLAMAFRRGYGSIEQIYRWASQPLSEIEATRPNDSFVKQIKRIAKTVGWRA